MKFKRKTTLEKGRLDIAPLIDVVLLLLIFFMLTSSFISQAGIRIDLPRAAASEPQDKESLVVSITKEGELYVDEEPVTWETFEERLVTGLALEPERVLVMKADQDVRHGKVVEVMSRARELGWRRLAIAAHPEREGRVERVFSEKNHKNLTP